eukprot:scaffold96305_cov44-Tisochrysis_lutea.AAC.1
MPMDTPLSPKRPPRADDPPTQGRTSQRTRRPATHVKSTAASLVGRVALPGASKALASSGCLAGVLCVVCSAAVQHVRSCTQCASVGRVVGLEDRPDLCLVLAHRASATAV